MKLLCYFIKSGGAIAPLAPPIATPMTTIHIHIHNYTHTHTQLYTYTYTTIHIHVHNYTHTHTQLYTYTYTTVHIHIHIRTSYMHYKAERYQKIYDGTVLISNITV